MTHEERDALLAKSRNTIDNIIKLLDGYSYIQIKDILKNTLDSVEFIAISTDLSSKGD